MDNNGFSSYFSFGTDGNLPSLWLRTDWLICRVINLLGARRSLAPFQAGLRDDGMWDHLWIIDIIAHVTCVSFTYAMSIYIYNMYIHILYIDTVRSLRNFSMTWLGFLRYGRSFSRIWTQKYMASWDAAGCNDVPSSSRGFRHEHWCHISTMVMVIFSNKGWRIWDMPKKIKKTIFLVKTEGLYTIL